MGRFGEGRRFIIVVTTFAAALSAAIWAGRQSLTLQTPAVVAQTADDEIYTGSILITPPRGDDCWQRYLDNLTGAMWDQGPVSCAQAIARSTSSTGGSPRLEAIAKGFRDR